MTEREQEYTREDYALLSAEIKRHMDLYYNEDRPQISDRAYDELMLRLKDMERAHPAWRTPDSPTQIIGGSAKRRAGVIVTHDVPMLSIEDVFSKEEVLSWVHEVRALHPDARFDVEQKIDGLSMSIRYEQGDMVLAETRGDGLQGEDVTANARVIPDVVKRLRTPYEQLEVRGEVYMTHAAFERTNGRQELAGKKVFANPRNCAAGTLRQLDAGMVRERGLSILVFNIQKSSDERLMRSHAEGLKRLAEEEHMAVAPSFFCTTDEEILAAIDAIGESRGTLDYDIDGAVVKIDQIAYRDDFPAGSKYSAGHIAYKYPPEEKDAVVTEIELSVGMTGRINPTAVFTPVRLCGTSVSRATLHNQDFIDKLGIGVGATVRVYKSGEIIPKIRAVVKEKTPDDLEVFRIPDICPVCGGRAVREKDTADMRCVNEDCPAKLNRRIMNFVGRDAMDIKGFGAEYVQALTGEGYLKDVSDIYLLHTHREELIEKGILGKEKGTDNVLNAIERSKANDAYRLLTGLGIANVGKASSKTLMRHFDTIEALSHARIDQLTEVPDIGETTARAIHDYFHTQAHAALLARLAAYGLNLGTARGEGDKEPAEGETVEIGALTVKTAPDMFAGRTYVVTGDLHYFKNREALTEFVERYGGRVAGSVSSRTYALINNDKASVSGKNKKAKTLGIPIQTEEEFLAAASGAPENGREQEG